MPVLTIGDQFPSYSLTAVIPGDLRAVEATSPEDYFTTVTSHVPDQTWRVVFFWPKDFTFICPTEIASFGNLYDDFTGRACQILGVSTDNEYAHYAWRRSHEKLRNIPFPLASDLTRNLATSLGVLNKEGICDRATFIIDPDNTIQFVTIDAGSVGRNTNEVLRQLDALQTGALCACNWETGATTIDSLNEMRTI